MKKRKSILKGSFKRLNPKVFENPVVLDCEKSKTTIDDAKKIINQVIDEKRPLIIESINLIFT